MPTDLITLPIGEHAPEIVHAVIEIPLGSRNKYEYRPDLGVIMRDRVLSAAVRYPTDYGFIPSTMTDDGDPLDILVAAYDPAFPGCVLLARPLGVLDMTDEKGRDYKIFAVPADDPRFAEVTSLDDLPSHILREVEHFFAVYKQLEEKQVEVYGWQGLERAHELIRKYTR
ncbi:MAG: inorganic diphosphatase [Chloroflexota bacterium]